MKTATQLDISPLTGALGAVIRGVDLRDVDDETWAAIRAIWLERLVIFFPEQDLKPEDHVALGRRFGEIDIHPHIPKLSPDFPEIIVLDYVSKIEEVWHTDVTFAECPPMASILRMERRAAVGGDTLFSNQYLAYEKLSPPMQAFLEGLTAVHTGAKFGHVEEQAEHPVVRVHPETGRKSLFVNRTFTSHIPQLHPAESETLLNYLYGWAERTAFQCRYSWSNGDIGIWDNRCTQHNVAPDFLPPRTIHRVTVDGDRPSGTSTSSWDHYPAPYRMIPTFFNPAVAAGHTLPKDDA